MSDAARYCYEFGPFSLDVGRRLMLKADQVVPLTSKAFDTLLALVQNHSRVMEKDELLKLIWPDTVVEERNLAVNISTLRKLLGESPESHEYIVTIPGRGYRFVAPVRELNGQSAIGQPGGDGVSRRDPDDSGATATQTLPPAPRRVVGETNGPVAGGRGNRSVCLGALFGQKPIAPGNAL